MSYKTPLVRSKNTRYDPDSGPFTASRGSGAGKGDIISGTFGEGWVENIAERLSKRTNKCGNIKCGIDRPEGVCSVCGHIPEGSSGW